MRTPSVRQQAMLLTVLLLFPAIACGQNLDTVQVTAQKLSDRVYVLFGSGGNIGLSVGDDGAFIVDDQFAPLSEKIKAAVARLSSKPIRFVVNTHWHGDHTGGNEKMGQAGAVIVAHENVRKRMSVEQALRRGGNTTNVPASPYAALPVITFTEDVTLHLNGDSIHVMHVPPAHTDGDALIFYQKANVIHMGDTFFAARYPFIDTSTGGTIDGIIGAADRALALVNDDTRIIPGHGPVVGRKELQQYRDVLTMIRGRILKLVVAGKALPDVVAAKPTAEFDATWGSGFINGESLIETIYNDLKARGVKR
ncbi:MAG: MBL fold metallo-hydrolase [Gemmatimonadaceae bacterium]